jgi:hypothetical protein
MKEVLRETYQGRQFGVYSGIINEWKDVAHVIPLSDSNNDVMGPGSFSAKRVLLDFPGTNIALQVFSTSSGGVLDARAHTQAELSYTNEVCADVEGIRKTLEDKFGMKRFTS